MGKINLGRVVLGGVVAAIVIDVWEGIMRGVVLRERGGRDHGCSWKAGSSIYEADLGV